MGRQDEFDRREPDRHRVRRVAVRPGVVVPTGRLHAAPRLEIRVCRVDDAWEVRPGATGSPSRHARLAIALGVANELARRAWIDDGLLSSVRRLTDEGTWEVDGVYGVVP